jgi:hypothetical protein
MHINYLDIVNPDNKSGEIQVEKVRWAVKGLHHTHEFRYILKAVASTNFIIHEEWVEHWINGTKIDEWRWGHGTEEAIKSSMNWKNNGRISDYSTDLISSHVFRHDLPCCGGEFVKDKEITDYFTLLKGHCNKCGQKWEITDGIHFNKPIRIDNNGLVVQE